MIDTHAHLHYSGRLPDEPPGITAAQMVDTMNRLGIDRTVLLPMESPELTSGFCMTEHVLEAAELYPERLIPFVHIDPRKRRCGDLIRHFSSHGLVKGFGELVDGLFVDDILRKRVYGLCGELGLPVIIYSSGESSRDEVGLPRLEKCLREFPGTIFIGHGQRWWNAISADDDGGSGYPSSPVVEGGAADRLLQEYGNLYADISAGSGLNAMKRDPAFTEGFIRRNHAKLFFGTDYLGPGQGREHVRWMLETPMEEEHRAAISGGNARRILKLD